MFFRLPRMFFRIFGYNYKKLKLKNNKNKNTKHIQTLSTNKVLPNVGLFLLRCLPEQGTYEFS